MSQKINDALDEMFTHYTTTDALKREVKYLVKGINEAKNKQAAQIYGKTKYCIQSVIKLALQQSKMPKVEYYARGFQSEVDRSEGTLEG